MTIAVVELLEVIDVEQQQRQLCLLADRLEAMCSSTKPANSMKNVLPAARQATSRGSNVSRICPVTTFGAALLRMIPPATKPHWQTMMSRATRGSGSSRIARLAEP